ncbi:MAG: sigma-70 family RNA polymerase sigma factor [Chitinophagaceae bacterium]|nr:sigma-70 family RNA polymerase sigma factor [Chitinophagaceae bacterium]
MADWAQLDDKALLAAFGIEHTKEKAFEALIKRYQERLYWHVRRMVVHHEDTNDILQNVFIKVWRNLAEFRAEANFYTWLYRIGTNETLTYIEKQKRNSSISISDNDEGENMYANKLKAEQGYDANKIEWKLQQAIHTLPEKQKLVFNLRYYDEMPYEKMSEILGTSEGALKASYHHAAKKVEAFLKDH